MELMQGGVLGRKGVGGGSGSGSSMLWSGEAKQSDRRREPTAGLFRSNVHLETVCMLQLTINPLLNQLTIISIID